MANEEQLSVLKQGVEVWNRWRKENCDVEVDLSGANLVEHYLKDKYPFEGSLYSANLNKANLSGTNLRGANLGQAHLEHTNLTNAQLNKADLNGAHLRGANLFVVDLTEANLWEADLSQANLNGANLRWSTWSWAKVEMTIFGNLDLRDTFGLEDIVYYGPATIGVDTFARSQGKIPEVFLRGCGLSDWEIELVKLYNPELSNDERNKILYKTYDLQASQAIQVSPLFISYSHRDSEFIDKVGNHLIKKGIRFWRDVHEMKAGRMEKQIDRAIRQNPTVLLVLSEHSLSSEWVEHEVRTTRALEKDMGRDMLCPVALDDSWKNGSWPKRVMEQIMEYNILDFSEWRDDGKFAGMFRKLIDGLELFYKG